MGTSIWHEGEIVLSVAKALFISPVISFPQCNGSKATQKYWANFILTFCGLSDKNFVNFRFSGDMTGLRRTLGLLALMVISIRAEEKKVSFQVHSKLKKIFADMAHFIHFLVLLKTVQRHKIHQNPARKITPEDNE